MCCIVLIGYRAVGKTSAGRLLADRLEYDFVDTDQLICEMQAATVAEIVEKKGWQIFRRYEEEALRIAVSRPRRVISTGGGAVLHQEVFEQIRRQNFVVWLRADLKILEQRLAMAKEGERPSLTGASIVAEMKDVLEQRTPLYRRFSDLAVDSGKLDIDSVVAEITTAYYAALSTKT